MVKASLCLIFLAALAMSVRANPPGEGDGKGAERTKSKAGGAPSFEGILVAVSLDGYINVKSGGEVKAVTLLKSTEQAGNPVSGATVRVWLEAGSKTRAARVEFKAPEDDDEVRRDRRERRDPRRTPPRGRSNR